VLSSYEDGISYAIGGIENADSFSPSYSAYNAENNFSEFPGHLDVFCLFPSKFSTPGDYICNFKSCRAAILSYRTIYLFTIYKHGNLKFKCFHVVTS